MLRYKTETRPGLVALYDIRPGNGAGPFLQPRSPHGATETRPVQSTSIIYMLHQDMHKYYHAQYIQYVLNYMHTTEMQLLDDARRKLKSPLLRQQCSSTIKARQ